MQLKTILNRVQKFKSFVYGNIVWLDSEENLALLVQVAARANSKPMCSGCGRPGPGYDTLEPRMFEFVPLWNIAVFFAYALRRVNCATCGVKVERVPWADGENTLTKTYMQHRPLLLNWFRARKTISSGVMEGLNNKLKLTTRKSYGFWTFTAVEIALYHTLGALPEPEWSHRFC